MDVNSLDLSSSSEAVLVIDDNEKLLQVVNDLLSKAGLVVVSAKDAREAFRYLEKETPSLILCDIMMPEVSGLEFHEQLSNISHLSAIPFVFLTALSDRKDIIKAKTLGCDDYITKPFDPEDLLAVVQGKLKSYKQRIKAEQEKSSLERKKIIHTLSHEFRTPLVSISSGAELLLYQHDALEDKQIKMLLRSIIRGGRRLEGLVGDFVLMQQIDSGQAKQLYERYKRPRPLMTLVDDALSEFYRKHSENGLAPIEISERDTDTESTEVQVYDLQIVSALERILSNGLKFAGKEKPISIKLKTDSEHASICIRDQGPGLPEKLHNEVFELFQQVNRSYNEQQGAGLGLSIASYFTKINGGELLFSTPEDGIGLEVVVKLPLSTS